MASNCRHCDAPIIWIAKPSGGWFRPFDAPPELLNLEYEVAWDKTLQDWTAAPLDREMTAKLQEHDCPRRAEILAARRERDQEEMEEREPLPPLEREVARLNAADYVTRIDPGPRYGSRVVFRDPKPEKFVTMALRLRRRCPTCGAMPFEWCSYLRGDKQGQFTQQLHTSRKATD